MNLDEWLERIEQLHPKSWDLGLERVGEVAQRLDVTRPGNRVVLVAGTNGKGSTCELVDLLCRQKGLSVGKSTSPHLVRFNERIAIDGQPAANDEIVRAFEFIEEARGDISLSYFEFAALASMLIFCWRGVDVAVLEIGLGGRLDAMNVVQPDVTVITRIALDHQDWLGDDRETIGREKAGIMRAGVPCIVADPNQPASIEARARQVGATGLYIGRDFGVIDGASGEDARGAFFHDGPGFETLPTIAIPAENVLAAIQATLCLGVELAGSDIERAINGFALPGRLEWREQPGKPRTLLDVGHNPDAAAWLAKQLETEGIRPCRAVFGAYQDKDIAGIVSAMAPFVRAWYIAGMDVERGAPPDEIARIVTGAGGSVAGKYAKVTLAYDAAVGSADAGEIVLVFGSFNIVGAVLEHLDEQHL